MSTPVLRFGPVSVYLGEKGGKYPDGNQVIVTGTDTKLAFDTPLVCNRLGSELDGVEAVVLGHMHEDHAAGLRRLSGAAVFAHEADLEAVRSWEGLARHYGYGPVVLARMREKIERDFHYAPRPDARAYRDGHVWDLGGASVRAIHMPGHTAGHCVLLVEPEGVAFIGDIDLTGFGPYYGDACSSLPRFRETLERVEHLPARVWVTSHHKGALTDRADFLALLRAFRDKIAARERAILDALAAGPRSEGELVAHRFLYPRGYQDTYVEDAERISLTQHLAELTGAGRVIQEGGRYRLGPRG
jgi:glyoxylase-like metal-dependent hydrolase (beta-lactamase superfamily II)